MLKTITAFRPPRQRSRLPRRRRQQRGHTQCQAQELHSNCVHAHSPGRHGTTRAQLSSRYPRAGYPHPYSRPLYGGSTNTYESLTPGRPRPRSRERIVWSTAPKERVRTASAASFACDASSGTVGRQFPAVIGIKPLTSPVGPSSSQHPLAGVVFSITGQSSANPGPASGTNDLIVLALMPAADMRPHWVGSSACPQNAGRLTGRRPREPSDVWQSRRHGNDPTTNHSG